MNAPSIHVVLVHPEIPGNTGNAGRTCLGAAAQLHLVKPLGFSLSDRQVRRAGLDYWERVKPIVWENWEQFESELPVLGEPFFFSAEGRVDLWATPFPEGRSDPVVLIFGREADGLPPELRAKYGERLVSLPMLDPKLRSLNLSNTVAIVVYELLRRRRAITLRAPT